MSLFSLLLKLSCLCLFIALPSNAVEDINKQLMRRIEREQENLHLTSAEIAELNDLRYSMLTEDFDIDFMEGIDKAAYDALVEIMKSHGLTDDQAELLKLGKFANKKEKKIETFGHDNGKGKSVHGLFYSVQTSEGVYDVWYAMCNIDYNVRHVHGHTYDLGTLKKHNRRKAYKFIGEQLSARQLTEL